jgi:hypothetical protein
MFRDEHTRFSVQESPFETGDSSMAGDEVMQNYYIVFFFTSANS